MKQSNLAQQPTQAHDAIAGDSLLHSKQLAYLNAEHAYSETFSESNVSKSAFGKFVFRFRRLLARLLLGDYLEAERAFQTRLVQHLNQAAKQHPQHTPTSTADSARRAELTKLTNRLASLESELALNKAQLAMLDNVAHGLEAIVGRLTSPPRPELPTAETTALETVPDFSYLLFENRFRGSSEQIKRRLEFYPGLFKEAKKPVLEIGTGRGELLELFREQRICAYAVELDQAMAEQAAQKGLDVRLGDGLSHLATLEAESLGGVLAIQVIEHLQRTQLEQFFMLAAKAVSKQGKVIVETINPRSLLALSSNYFRDPTHVWPLHPDTVCYIMELAGLRVLETRELSRVPQEAMLQPIPPLADAPAGFEHVTNSLNHNLRQLNELLYGYQDYCIIAEPR